MVRKGKEPAKKKDKDEEEVFEMSALSRAIARIQGAGPSSAGQRLTTTRTPPAPTGMASIPLELQTRLLEEPVRRLFDRYRVARFEHNRSQREHAEALRAYRERHGTEGFAGRLLRRSGMQERMERYYERRGEARDVLAERTIFDPDSEEARASQRLKTTEDRRVAESDLATTTREYRQSQRELMQLIVLLRNLGFDQSIIDEKAPPPPRLLPRAPPSPPTPPSDD